MFKVTVKPQWSIRKGTADVSFPKLLELLIAVDGAGNLAAGCRACGMSYRYAWGMLREGERLFGAPLLQMQRGRGSRLAPLGEKLVWADRRVTARLSPVLDSLASELESEIEQSISAESTILRIQASHGFAIDTLREFLVREQVPVELKYRGTQEAVAALASLTCDVAGFPVPVGEFESRVVQHYARWIQPSGIRLIHVATRRQGLMVAPGNPKKIYSFADLQNDNVHFINRQHGSGTRLLLDMLLAKGRIDPQRIRGYDEEEYTHAAVAAFIASGMADVGFGIETPARQFKLEFMPVATERYFLACRGAALHLPQVQQLIAILASPAYRAAVDALPGYQGRGSGVVMGVREAFPLVAQADRPASRG